MQIILISFVLEDTAKAMKENEIKWDGKIFLYFDFEEDLSSWLKFLVR